MTIVADAGALYAAFDRRDHHHDAVTTFLSQLDEHLLIPPLILAELDHIAAVRLGEIARASIIAEIAEIHDLALFTQAMLMSAAEAASQYGDLPLGLTDASIMVVAFEHGTHDILTVDQRHFRTVRPIAGGPDTTYRLLPFDA